MRFDKIQAHESKFLSNGISIAGAKFELEKKSIAGLDYIKCRPADSDIEYYYSEKHTKTSAVLHLTEGYIKSDVYYLTHKGHVSVPFLIPRSGDILNLHPSSDWAYHLGKTASGGNTTMSKGTIPIELSNIGKLKRIGDNLHTRYGDIYCTIDDVNEYVFVENGFRGYDYFASFTDEQYESLTVLLKYLNAKRGIKLKFLPEDKRFKKMSSTAVKKFRGILSHVNFREDLDKNGAFKKVDIGNGFQWDRLINSLK